MIIPSIDIMDGQAVQLIGGKEKALEAGDPIPLLKKFSLAGEVAVIDLDAALGRGSNAEIIEKMVRMAPCRVGGGIRDLETARKWLDLGASKIILGTMAEPELLKELPKNRVIAALDAEFDEVVVEGWQKKTGLKLIDRIKELRDYVGGFLVTLVEREGRLGGVEFERVETLVDAANMVPLTLAGGIVTTEEIAKLDRLNVDAQVGMAIYTGKMDFAEAIIAPMVSEREDGLWPTVVTDERGVALGLVYSNEASVKEAVKLGQGVYHSRRRGLWVKGLTSGAEQDLLGISLDCDRDALRFRVHQHGAGFCHLDQRTCWGDDHGLGHLVARLSKRLKKAPEGSYTKRLLDDPELLKAKLIEEAEELADAVGKDNTIWETADLMYFALVAMIRGGASVPEVEAELDRRSLKVTRRPGNAKPKKD